MRLHYVYPYPHVDEVIPLMAEGKVLPYLDVPFQHASPARAQADAPAGRAGKNACHASRMARDLSRSHHPLDFHRRLSRRDRSGFSELLDWLDEAELDRVGCFRYEPVSGATANDLAAPVPDEIKDERWDRLMRRQREISKRRLKRKVGTRQAVLIDEVAKGRGQGPQQG